MKRTIRAIMAVGLTVTLLGVPEALLAARRKGAQLRLTMTNNELVQGELIGVRGETLVLLTDEGDRTVGLGEVATLLIKDKSGTIIGGLAGVAAGAILDAAFWHSFKKDTRGDEAGEFMRALFTPGAIAVMGLIPVAAGLTGMLVGHAAHKGKTYKIQGMTQDERRGLTETLRKHAVVPDYK